MLASSTRRGTDILYVVSASAASPAGARRETRGHRARRARARHIALLPADAAAAVPVADARFLAQLHRVGLLTTTFFVISGIGQALAGFVVDRVGGWRVLLLRRRDAGALRRRARLRQQLSLVDVERDIRRSRQQHLSSRGFHTPQSARESAAIGTRVFDPRLLGQRGVGGCAALHGRRYQRVGLARRGIRRGCAWCDGLHDTVLASSRTRGCGTI